MSPATVRREMRRKSKSTFKMIQVILISFSILFILIVSISITYGFNELNQEEKSKNNDLILDPNEYFFNRATILTISVMTIMSLVLGIIAVTTSSFCLLLFSGTSGSAIFLTQVLVLIIENIITPFTALILGAMVTVYGCAILYLAYKTNVYKDYHRTVSPRETKLMEPTIVRRTSSRSASTTASSASTLNEHLTLDERDLINSFSTFSDREELCSKEMPIANVDIGLVKIQK